MFVGGGIDSRLEIDAKEVEGIPPVPGYLARPDPGGFNERMRPRQLIDQSVAHQGGIVADHQETPGVGARASGLGNIIGAGERNHIAIGGEAVPGDHRREAADQGAGALITAGEPETGIIVEIGLTDENPRPARHQHHSGRHPLPLTAYP